MCSLQERRPRRDCFITPRIAPRDGENRIEIYFENETDRQVYLGLGLGQDHEITLRGNDSDDYVAEG
jgi:hypothetical protein